MVKKEIWEEFTKNKKVFIKPKNMKRNAEKIKRQKTRDRSRKEGRIMRRLVILWGMISLIFLCGCGPGKKEETKESAAKESGNRKIGFSQPDLKGSWRVAQLEDLCKEAKRRGYELVSASAENDADRQAADIREMVENGCGLILVSAVDTEKIRETLDFCKEKNVPVFLIDRVANAKAGEDYVTAILSDLAGEGKQIALWAAGQLHGMGVERIRAVEITGIVGGSDTRDRSKGFREGAEEAGGIEIIASQSGEFSRTVTSEVMKNLIISSGQNFQLVFCHNDEMALGAYMALENAGIQVGRDVLLCSIDGQQEAFEAILAGKLSCTVTCSPLFGTVVFDTMDRYLRGEEIPPMITNEDTLIDADNIRNHMDKAF